MIPEKNNDRLTEGINTGGIIILNACIYIFKHDSKMFWWVFTDRSIFSDYGTSRCFGGFSQIDPYFLTMELQLKENH